MREEDRREDVRLLQDLIRFDTTNPPGNETPAAEYLKTLFDREGIACEIVESEPGRGSFIATMNSGTEKPSLLLLSHLDVVPATEPQSWKHPPFSGEIDDGWIYGRGAIDTKSLTAAEAMTMILLKREGVKLRGPLKMASVADEERGGTYGAKWITEKHPEKIKADFIINEGGGAVIKTRKGPLYLVEAEEKGILWIKIITRGVAKHASVPELGISAVAKMSQVLAKVAQHKTRIRPSKVLRESLQAFERHGYLKPKNIAKTLLNPKTSDKGLELIRKQDPVGAAIISALLRPTISETMVRGGVKENIIPDYCEAIIDSRLPQGVTKEGMLRELRRVIGPVRGVEFEVLDYAPASTSPTNNDFYRTIKKTIKQTVGQNAETIPSVVTGATDSSYLRPLGSIAYGFAPTSPDVSYDQISPLVHAIDERINLESLYTSTDFLVQLSKNLLS